MSVTLTNQSNIEMRTAADLMPGDVIIRLGTRDDYNPNILALNVHMWLIKEITGEGTTAGHAMRTVYAEPMKPVLSETAFFKTNVQITERECERLPAMDLSEVVAVVNV